MVLVEEITELILSEYGQYSFFQNDQQAKKRIQKQAQEYLAKAKDGDAFHFVHQQQLQGFILCWKQEFPFFGVNAHQMILSFQPGSDAALDWGEKVLRSLDWSAYPLLFSTLSITHSALLPTLLEMGIGIDSLYLLGNTQLALDNMIAQYHSLDEFSELGLVDMPLAEEHLDAVVDLRAQSFRQQPEYCWFGANQGHLQAYRQGLKEELDGEHLWSVLLDQGQVVGIYGCSLVPDDPLWGNCGGLELIFAPAYRGKGIAKIAYTKILKELVNRKYAVFKGCTAQPAVMKLGKIMDRELVQIHFRNNAFFPKEHFRSYLS